MAHIPRMNGKPYDPGPPPDRELGRNLHTVEDARVWLTHPSNWHDSQLFIVKWDGAYPTVQTEKGQYLIDRPDDVGLLEVVVWQQKQIKRGKKVHADPTPILEE